MAKSALNIIIILFKKKNKISLFFFHTKEYEVKPPSLFLVVQGEIELSVESKRRDEGNTVVKILKVRDLIFNNNLILT